MALSKKPSIRKPASPFPREITDEDRDAIARKLREATPESRAQGSAYGEVVNAAVESALQLLYALSANYRVWSAEEKAAFKRQQLDRERFLDALQNLIKACDRNPTLVASELWWHAHPLSKGPRERTPELEEVSAYLKKVAALLSRSVVKKASKAGTPPIHTELHKFLSGLLTVWVRVTGPYATRSTKKNKPSFGAFARFVLEIRGGRGLPEKTFKQALRKAITKQGANSLTKRY